MLLYTVACEFDSVEVARQWVEWLEREHLADVCCAGAESAEVIRVDAASIAYQVQYRFRTRAAFESYERDHAPRLRAEGLKRFPLELGLRYSRSTGEVIARSAPACPKSALT